MLRFGVACSFAAYACARPSESQAGSCGPAEGAPEIGDEAALLQAVGRAPTLSAELVAKWEQEESVAWDAEHDCLFVSNTNGSIGVKAGMGFISKVPATTGRENQEVNWMTGLDAPLGLAVSGGYLYAADVDTLRVIEISTKTIVKNFTVTVPRFLNDVAVGCGGEVYVSDFDGNTIWRLAHNELKKWFHSEELNTPNGLKVSGRSLLVASWGPRPDANFVPESPGALLSVDRATKAIKVLTNSDFAGSLDGVELVGGHGGIVATEFFRGQVLQVLPGGAVRKLANMTPTAADLAYVKEKGLLFVPNLGESYISVFKISSSS